MLKHHHHHHHHHHHQFNYRLMMNDLFPWGTVAGTIPAPAPARVTVIQYGDDSDGLFTTS
jgi:hypothetical protein